MYKSLLSRSLAVLATAIFLNYASSFLSPKVKSAFENAVYTRNMSITPVKLYGSPTSTCTRRVATVLREKEVPYELVEINFAKAEHKDPTYIETKQPFGQVPVLVDGDFILYESRAISRYVATKFASQGTQGLIPPPSDLQAWAKFEEAASVEQNNFDPYASVLAFEKVFKVMRGGQTDEARVKELAATLEAKMDGYEKILSKHNYLAGNEVTLADLFHLPYGAMVEKLGYNVLSKPSRTSVARWWKDISSRQAWLDVKDSAKPS